MDILRIVDAGRKHWRLLVVGAVLGVALAALGFRYVDGADGPSIEPRAGARYQARTRLLISEPGADLTRARTDPALVDPFGKTVNMAPTYAYLASSDEVLRRAEHRLGRVKEKVSSRALRDAPVIEVTITGSEADHTLRVASVLAASFRDYIEEQQLNADVPPKERIQLRVLSAPKEAKRLRSGAVELAAVSFMAPFLACLGFALAIENARRLRDEGDGAA